MKERGRLDSNTNEPSSSRGSQGQHRSRNPNYSAESYHPYDRNQRNNNRHRNNDKRDGNNSHHENRNHNRPQEGSSQNDRSRNNYNNSTYNNSNYNTNNSRGNDSRNYQGSGKKNEDKLVENQSLNGKWQKLKEIAKKPSQLYDFNNKIDVVYDINGVLIIGQVRLLTLRLRANDAETSITPYTHNSPLLEILHRDANVYIMCHNHFYCYELNISNVSLTCKYKSEELERLVHMEWYSDNEILICDIQGGIFIFNTTMNVMDECVSGNLGLPYGLCWFSVCRERNWLFASGRNTDLEMGSLSSMKMQRDTPTSTFERGGGKQEEVKCCTFVGDWCIAVGYNTKKIGLFTVIQPKSGNDHTLKLSKFQIIAPATEYSHLLADKFKILVVSRNGANSKVSIYRKSKSEHRIEPNKKTQIFEECSAASFCSPQNQWITSFYYRDDLIVFGTQIGKVYVFDLLK